MPYTIKKTGKKYSIINKITGETVGKSGSKKKAQGSVNIRMGKENGWRPSKKKK